MARPPGDDWEIEIGSIRGVDADYLRCREYRQEYLGRFEPFSIQSPTFRGRRYTFNINPPYKDAHAIAEHARVAGGVRVDVQLGPTGVGGIALEIDEAVIIEALHAYGIDPDLHIDHNGNFVIERHALTKMGQLILETRGAAFHARDLNIMDRGSRHRQIPFINLSDNTVTFDAGAGAVTVPPGGSVDVPEPYTKWRGSRKPIITELAPQLSPQRIECQTCGTLIGQADASGTYVCWQHLAPCGLPCAGRGHDADGLPELHRNDRECARCAPMPCPVCRGRGNTGFIEREYMPVLIDKYALHEHAGDLRTAPTYQQPITCTRCNGRRTVPGIEIWKDEHDDGT